MRASITTLTTVLAVLLLAAPPAAQAQQAGRVYRIGYISTGAPSSPLVEAFRRGMQDLGYIEGRNLVIDFRLTAGRTEQLRMLADELVQRKVEVIVTTGIPAIRAAMEATRTIPIVVMMGSDPVAAGLVSSMARPGGNLTGLTAIAQELNLKRLEVFKEALPSLSRIAVLWDPATTTMQPQPLEAPARSLFQDVKILEAGRLADFEAAFAAATREKVGGLVVLTSALFHTHRHVLADLSKRRRLPAIYEHRSYVDAGGLISYGANFQDLWRRGAVYVDKLLKGAKPNDLPIEQPTKFELIINLKTHCR